MALTKSSVRCVGEELWWAIEQTPSEVEARVASAAAHDAEFVVLTNADPEGEPSKWNGREIRLRTKFIAAIAPPLSPIEEDQEE
jgi:hypothetical protein